MAAIIGYKRNSTEAGLDLRDAIDRRVPTKAGSPSASDDDGHPLKRRKIGITMMQKQALINNLQVEIAYRARRLREQCNKQAEHLRTRVEMRVNRIPPARRQKKMGDIIGELKARQGQPPKPLAALVASSRVDSDRPPPVPEKDVFPTRPLPKPTAAQLASASRVSPARPVKRTSDEMAGSNKENDDAARDASKKRPRTRPETNSHQPSKVLSPTSSNTRLLPSNRLPPSPAKSFIARPISPTKTLNAGHAISALVNTARPARGAAVSRTTGTSTTTTSSSTSSKAAPVKRGRKPAVPTQSAAVRSTRNVSGISEFSTATTLTVVKKTTSRGAATKAAASRVAAAGKKTVMSTIKKGVAGSSRQTVVETSAASTATGRVLRKRN